MFQNIVMIASLTDSFSSIITKIFFGVGALILILIAVPVLVACILGRFAFKFGLIGLKSRKRIERDKADLYASAFKEKEIREDNFFND